MRTVFFWVFLNNNKKIQVVWSENSGYLERKSRLFEIENSSYLQINWNSYGSVKISLYL